VKGCRLDWSGSGQERLSPSLECCNESSKLRHTGSLGFFIDIIHPALGSNHRLTEVSTKGIAFGVKAAGA